MAQINLDIDQNILMIQKEGEILGYIETIDGKLVTTGYIGDFNEYDNFVDLLMALKGFDISIDNFYSLID